MWSSVDQIQAAGGRALAIGRQTWPTRPSGRGGGRPHRRGVRAPQPSWLSQRGIIRDNMLHKMLVDDWDAVMNAHLRGPLVSCALQPSMRELRGAES